ncbi:MAG: HupE/UreJ family protein [Chromatiales bacterium]|jgi:urease accessory protein|nr:MAG: HupE/UreJ family protein [Chromatiales bacterium]
MISLDIRNCLRLLLLVALPGPVLAHEGSSLPLGSFLGGLTHPVLGPDHFLAMVSVGILSAQIGGRAIWTVPAAFVLAMAVGGGLGIINSGLTIVEAGIALSVLVLGIAIAAERNLPLGLAMASVGFFGIFHGYAHGTEMPSVAEPIRYAAGFLTGTALLHILGIIIGDISQHYARGKVLLRLAGAAIASIGTWFLVTTT